mgnify:CR=1 FL=1
MLSPFSECLEELAEMEREIEAKRAQGGVKVWIVVNIQQCALQWYQLQMLILLLKPPLFSHHRYQFDGVNSF